MTAIDSTIDSAFLTARIHRRISFMLSTVGVPVVVSAQNLCAGLFNKTGNPAAGPAVIAVFFLFYRA